jgi:hypothetical protein
VVRFLHRLEPEVLQLQRELLTNQWHPGLHECFEIRDPKVRTITAVPFRDRVVHHALIRPLEPLFERRMIPNSFACRRGKGTHAALRRARQLVRRFRYFLKLDVASFFPSVHHEVVRETLARIIKDRSVLALCDRILAGPADRSSSVGLPIGSLTSQWFANLVLDRADHFVKEQLRVRGYVRYMDDTVLCGEGRAELWRAHAHFRDYLKTRLRLQLKESATRLAPVSEGLPFLGWRIFPGTIRLQPENLRRYRWRLRLRRWQWESGLCDEESYRQAVASVYAHIRHGSTLGLRRHWARQCTAEI